MSQAERAANYRKRKAAEDPNYKNDMTRIKNAKLKAHFEEMSPGQKVDIRAKGNMRVKAFRDRQRRYLCTLYNIIFTN